MKINNGAPIAEPISEAEDFTPNPEGPELPPGIGGPIPGLPFDPQWPPKHWPPRPLCFISFKQGCYKIHYQPVGRPTIFAPYYAGTLRVENSGSSKIISGDLYRLRNLWGPIFDPIPPFKHLDEFGDETGDGEKIPIYARNKYYSYLKGIRYIRPSIFSSNCKLTIEFEEWRYNQPAAGSFNGSFNNAPTRNIKFVVGQGGDLNSLKGNVYEGSTLLGTVTLTWVSNFFRRAVVEIDTLTGAVAPQPLNPGTASEESFATIYNTVGWKMTPIYNDTNIAVPAGITATNCWSDADLHALMMAVRSTAVTLDSEWRYHMLVVPGRMGCSRGKMYDVTGVHREGCVSYSNDGYPTSDSSNFGAAAGQQQRNVPRAFIRSAGHELGHTCNMVHQEGEGGADNSIMTTTPSVADVLGSATTGAPGVFPTNIHLGFNAHCRRHLVHFPDPVVRPGCMNWTAGHSTFAPSADVDRMYLDAEAVSLKIKTQSDRIKIGEPLLIAWEVENLSKEAVPLPNDIGTNIEYTSINVTDPNDVTTNMPGFVIECEHSSIQPLAPGKKLAAATNLFWSSKGFAFNRAGKHIVEVNIRWTKNGTQYGLSQTKEIWVDYPAGDKDNEIAATMLDAEVGKFVALGGGAYHLKEAVSRISKVMKLDPKHAVAKSLNRLYSASAAKAYSPVKIVRTKKKGE